MQPITRPMMPPLILGYVPLATFILSQRVLVRIDHASWVACAAALICLTVLMVQKLRLNPILLALNINFILFPLVLETLFAMGQSEPAILLMLHVTEAMLLTVCVVFIAITFRSRRGLFQDAKADDAAARIMSLVMCVIGLGLLTWAVLDRSQFLANTGFVLVGLIIVRRMLIIGVASLSRSTDTQTLT